MNVATFEHVAPVGTPDVLGVAFGPAAGVLVAAGRQAPLPAAWEPPAAARSPRRILVAVASWFAATFLGLTALAAPTVMYLYGESQLGDATVRVTNQTVPGGVEQPAHQPLPTRLPLADAAPTD